MLRLVTNMKLDPALAQLVIDHLDNLAIADSEGRYIYVNKAWSDYSGFKPEDVLGKYVKDIIPDSKIDQVLQNKKPMMGEVLNFVGKKPTIPAYIPIFENGELTAVAAFGLFRTIDEARPFKQRLEMLSQEVKYLKKELSKIKGSRYSIDNIIGESAPMVKLREQIYQAARSNSVVLIDGETGSGKELVAHAIHNLSPRKINNFVKINCAAIPTELLESELFGYEEGAFTGARKGGRAGKFEMADNGSLFLDEVNQLSLALQPKLLRVLQEKEIDRVGGLGSKEINVRVIAATNRSLNELVNAGKFREDLYFRLNVMYIEVPPLRKRKEDLSLLVDSLIHRLNRQLGIEVRSITPRAVDLLMQYDWPGNVRELQNVLERAMNIAWGETLDLEHLEWFVESKKARTPSAKWAADGGGSLRLKKKALERAAIIEALASCGGNKVQAARQLNISRTMLYNLLRELRL